MQKIGFGFALIVSLAGALTPAVAQNATPIAVPAYPSACVDFTAEYMGCWNYGPPPEAQPRTEHDQLHVSVARKSFESPTPTARSCIAGPDTSAAPQHSGERVDSGAP